MPRCKAFFLAGLFAMVVSLAAFSRAQDQGDADSQARIVRISQVQGQVQIDSGHGYENATMNVPISEGNWLETRSDGWAEVQLEDGSTIRLAPETQIVFSRLARFASGGTATTVDLDQGEAEFKITKRDDSEFQVTVNAKTIALDSTGCFRVTSTNSNPLEIAVWKGSVAVRDTDSGGEVDVLKNETFQLDAQDVGQYALDKGAEADELDQWSQQRDDYSTYASSGNGYTQSPYQYGVNDLDRYGQYVDVPDYGYVWQPNDVGPDWDPYTNGYWSDSPTFGVYWVSAYPWGWMPFRYGNWIFVRGRGWCWQPGGWNRWHRSPRLVNAPPGFHPPVPPARRIASGGDRDDRHVHRPVGPSRIAGDLGHDAQRGRGVDDLKNADQHRPAGPGRITGDLGHDAQRGRGIDDLKNDQQGSGDRGRRRVFTNEDVQSKEPPATPQPEMGAKPMERRPPVADRSSSGAGQSGSGLDTSHSSMPVGTRPVETPVDRTRFLGPPVHERPAIQPSPKPVQQYTPPVMQQSPPARQFTPPAPQPRPVPPAPAPKQADTDSHGKHR